MSWKINGTIIPAPSKKEIIYNTQKVTNRVVSGALSRAYIGAEKVYLSCEWQYIDSTSFGFIKAAYDDQRLNGTTKTLTVDEFGSFNHNVIIDLLSYELPIPNHYNYGTLKIDFLQI